MSRLFIFCYGVLACSVLAAAFLVSDGFSSWCWNWGNGAIQAMPVSDTPSNIQPSLIKDPLSETKAGDVVTVPANIAAASEAEPASTPVESGRGTDQSTRLTRPPLLLDSPIADLSDLNAPVVKAVYTPPDRRQSPTGMTFVKRRPFLVRRKRAITPPYFSVGLGSQSKSAGSREFLLSETHASIETLKRVFNLL